MEIILLVLLVVIVIMLQTSVYKRHIFDRLGYRCVFSMDEAHEGDSLYMVETVHNRKLLPVPWLKVDMTVSRWLGFEGTQPVENLEKRYLASGYFLKGYQKTTRRWKLECQKRGVYTIDTVTLVGGDFLGLNTVSVPVAVNASLTVYPATIDLEDMLVSANYLQGNTIVKRWIVDDPFIIAGAREYIPGDPMNRVHWTATARTGTLMTRKNDFTSHISLTVILNIQSLENEFDQVVGKETTELGIKAAATLLDRALKFGTPARLATNGCLHDEGKKQVFTAEAAGKVHISQLLLLLAKLELRKSKDIEVFLEAVSGEIKNSHVVFITAFSNDRIVEGLKKITRQNNEISVIMLDGTGDRDMEQNFGTYYISGADKK